MTNNTSDNNFRIEINPMNSDEQFKIPQKYYYGAQTVLSLRHFNIGEELSNNRMPRGLIHALIMLKQAATVVNRELKLLDDNIADAIIESAKEISQKLRTDFIENFPLACWQTGSGTQTNMNVNEVLACKANEVLTSAKNSKTPVHPNDHVNKGQSSNDTFPTGMHIVTLLTTFKRLLPSLLDMYLACKQKSQEFQSVIKVGRTHTQDATPITLGQEFSAYKTQILFSINRILHSLGDITYLAQGGTAVGTGINCHKDFPVKFAKEITTISNIKSVSEEFLQSFREALSTEDKALITFPLDSSFTFKTAPNKFEALSTNDAIVSLSGTLNTLATSIMKIANDIRFLASGPRSGIGEISVPENEPGSSIMPGKTNPTQAEALTMIACQVMGNHTAITIGGSNGHFQLNVFRPMIIKNTLESIHLLADGIKSFNIHCLQGITHNETRIKNLLNRSLMLVTALNQHIGYDNAAKIAKNAHKKDITLEESAKELDFLGEGKQIEPSKWKEILDPLKMI